MTVIPAGGTDGSDGGDASDADGPGVDAGPRPVDGGAGTEDGDAGVDRVDPDPDGGIDPVGGAGAPQPTSSRARHPATIRRVDRPDPGWAERRITSRRRPSAGHTLHGPILSLVNESPRPEDRLVQVVEELRDEVRRLQQRVDRTAAPGPEPAHPTDGHPPPALPAWRRPTRGEQRWEVSVAVGLMIVLQLALPGALTPVGRWTLPAIELVIVVILVAGNPFRIERSSPWLRAAGLSLLTVAGLANALAVVLLVKDLISGDTGDDPVPLLATGANIWITNVIIFALLFWEFDRGGPAARSAGTRPRPDFLFPQMAGDSGMFRTWEPRFSDYAYVSFTNATAFSPTDTMPMTRWTKLAMMVESAVSLVTAALVIARAVNVLR